jgi:predicted ATPase
MLTEFERNQLREAVSRADDLGRTRETDWRVLIGAPGSGKSTLLNLLSASGYAVVKDPARCLIDQALKQGISPQSSRHDYREFQWRVLEHSRSRMKTLDDRATTFFDYGVAECLAFLKVAGLEWESAMVEAVVEVRFASAYLLELVPDSYLAPDFVRTEPRQTRMQLQALISEIYTAIDQPPTLIPCAPVVERARFLETSAVGTRLQNHRTGSLPS